MTTRMLLSEEEYLRTSFDGPDREYADGEVVTRKMGDKRHSRAQLRASVALERLAARHPLVVYTELRLHVAPRRYLIPDVCAYFGPEPEELVPSIPPFVIAEVVSPDDPWSEVLGKLEVFRAWGVPNVWLADPILRKLYTYDDQGPHEVAEWRLPDLGEAITAADVFGPA